MAPTPAPTPLTPTTLLPHPSNLNTRMPCIGFGTWDSSPSATQASCQSALAHGYRHIDTAQYYGNEAEVGLAVSASGIPRTAIFLTTKILTPRGSPEKTYQSLRHSVALLDPGASAEGRTPYVDQVLIHNVLGSAAQRAEVWGALERLFSEGSARSIGVSNWGIGLIEEMRGYAREVWPPHANQIELHPWSQQRALVAYCEEKGIALSAYAPLVRGRETHHPTLVAVAKAHSEDRDGGEKSRSTAQVLIRYCLQKGWAPLPKSDREDRIMENIDVFDFELSEEEMRVLDGVRSYDEDDPVVQVAVNE